MVKQHRLSFSAVPPDCATQPVKRHKLSSALCHEKKS